MSIETISAEACYFTKTNIVHPTLAAGAALTAAETKAKAEIAATDNAATVTGGSISPAR